MEILIGRTGNSIAIASPPEYLYRFYFGMGGKFYPSGKDNGVFNQYLINIGGDNYQVLWSDLKIQGVVPTSFADAGVKLTNLFANL
jgi:hypothetical protein